MTRPRVTIGVEGAAPADVFKAALDSAQRQTLGDLEIIVLADDSLPDRMRAARSAAAEDRRIRVEPRGAGGVLDRLIELARGEWYAAFNDNDRMHPERIERLVNAAERADLDIVADDILIVSADSPQGARRRFRGVRARAPLDLPLAAYGSVGAPPGGGMAFVPLMPIFRLDRIRGNPLPADPMQERYDLRWLLESGLKARTYPDLTYFHHVRTPQSAREMASLPDAKAVCLISRQRLVGAVNGSSTYLLDLAEALRAAGFTPHLLQPTPAMLGRWPIMVMRPEMEVFESIQIRGVGRIGRRVVIALDPKIWANAVRAVAAVALRKLRLPFEWLGARPAPYSIAAVWSDADRLYIARHAPRLAAAGLLLDYVFQVEAIPYAGRTKVRSAVVMHDLFHPRAAAFAGQGSSDSVASLTAEREASLLSEADAVIAIQAAEADWVRRNVPGTTTLLAPIAAHAVARPQPGQDDSILFVGSFTAPNVVALEWFFAQVWPKVRQMRPQARLEVAGSVVRGRTGPPPPGVQFLGVVDDLQALYGRAGVVISPLTVGSGLKIKLVEALAAGKAIVATSITLQGVESLADEAVRRADDPDDFADALCALAGDLLAREALATRALEAARAGFSSEACYGEMIAWFKAGAAERELSGRSD